jgi:carboxyl-terminal processing protease
MVQAERVNEDATAGVLRVITRSGQEQVLDLAHSQELLPWLSHDLLDNNVGYVRLYQFPVYLDCEGLLKIRGDLDNAIADLRARGAQSWVFDFRHNGGGSGETAAIVASTLGFDGLLYRARDKEGRRNSLEIVGENSLGKEPLVVMVNGQSASSSEIVAYALQDARRAHVVGTQSKGSVVAAYSFPMAGGAFFITGAFIDVGPGGKVIDKVGVKPDTKVELDLALLRAEGRDSQLEAALSYLKQKTGR